MPARRDPAGNFTMPNSLGRRRKAVERRQVGVQEGVIGGEQLHEIAVVPDQVVEQLAGLLQSWTGQFGS